MSLFIKLRLTLNSSVQATEIVKDTENMAIHYGLWTHPNDNGKFGYNYLFLLCDLCVLCGWTSFL